MKTFIMLATLLFSVQSFGVQKFKEKLLSAKSNLDMKKASQDLLNAYEKEIFSMESKIGKSFRGNSRKNFDSAKKNWQNFYISESRFLGLEFSQRNKYGSSGSLRAKNLKIGLLEKRYNYLKDLIKTRGL